MISADLTLDEVTRAARRLGYALRPWVDSQQGNRGFGRQDNNGGPSWYQNGGSPQQGPKFNQNGHSGARTQNPIRGQTPIGEVKCWTCGKTGHYVSDCKTNGPKFAFAPKMVRMNYLQDCQIMTMQKKNRTTTWETIRSLWRDPYYSSQGFSSSP